MDVYKIYASTRTKDGKIIKSDHFITKSGNKDEAIADAIKAAKLYGFRGKVHIHNVYKRGENKVYTLID